MTARSIELSARSPRRRRGLLGGVDGDLAAPREAARSSPAGAGSVVNTERLYAGRAALFLSWCAGEGISWTQVRSTRWRVQAMARRRAAPSRRREAGGQRRHRSPPRGRDLGTVCEFLRFCAIHELVDAGLVAKLYETASCASSRRLEPARTASSARCDPRAQVRRPETPFEFIEPDRVDELVAAATNAATASSSRSWR